jgi:hypothetical protein
MSDNPNRQITIFFIAVLMIILFFMTFAFFFLGQTSGHISLPGLGTDLNRFDDPVDPVEPSASRKLPVKSSQSSSLPPMNRGQYIPKTEAERAYFTAARKVATMKKRGLSSRQRHNVIDDFFKSPLGQNLKATFELARRGQSASAKQFLNRILGDLVEMDPMIQQYVLQTAISIYAHDKDKDGLSSILSKYLTFAEENNIGNEDKRNDLIEGVRRKVGELNN